MLNQLRTIPLKTTYNNVDSKKQTLPKNNQPSFGMNAQQFERFASAAGLKVQVEKNGQEFLARLVTKLGELVIPENAPHQQFAKTGDEARTKLIEGLKSDRYTVGEYTGSQTDSVRGVPGTGDRTVTGVRRIRSIYG